MLKQRLIWFLHTANRGGIHALVERFCQSMPRGLSVIEVCPAGSLQVEMVRGEKRRVRVTYKGFRLSASLRAMVATFIGLVADAGVVSRCRRRDFRRGGSPARYIVTGFFLPHIVCLLRLAGAPTTVTLNSDLIGRRFGRASVGLYQLLGCRVVCEGAGVAAKYGVPTGKGDERLFYPIVSQAAFRRDDAIRSQARASLGIDDQTVVIGGLGNFVRQKGWDKLVTMAETWKPIPNCKLLIVGRYQEQQREWFEGAVRTRVGGVKTPVQVVECEHHANFYFNAFDVFILPSVAEGVATVTLEAMNCGLPIVANDVGSVADVVRDGFNGHIVDPFDSVAWRERILHLAENPEERLRMGRNSLKLIESEFSEEQLRRRLSRAIMGEWEAGAANE